MDFLLSTHGAKYECTIPDGLRELMMDISREVLRTKPEQIYSFIADYLDALLITRENSRVAARIVASLADASATIAEMLVRTGMTIDQADMASKIIQESFRAHTEIWRKGSPEKLKEFEILQEIIRRTNVDAEQAVKAAIVIQSAFKSYRSRQDKEDITVPVGEVDWQVASRNTMKLYEKTRPTKDQMLIAATLIQAAYRGYYTRRNLFLKRQRERELEKQMLLAAGSDVSCLCSTSSDENQDGSAPITPRSPSERVAKYISQAGDSTDFVCCNCTCSLEESEIDINDGKFNGNDSSPPDDITLPVDAGVPFNNYIVLAEDDFVASDDNVDATPLITEPVDVDANEDDVLYEERTETESEQEMNEISENM